MVSPFVEYNLLGLLGLYTSSHSGRRLVGIPSFHSIIDLIATSALIICLQMTQKLNAELSSHAIRVVTLLKALSSARPNPSLILRR